MQNYYIYNIIYSLANKVPQAALYKHLHYHRFGICMYFITAVYSDTLAIRPAPLPPLRSMGKKTGDISHVEYDHVFEQLIPFFST